MKYVDLIDDCYPDYFSGYHLPVLQVAYSETLTFEQLAKEMELEINMMYEYLFDEYPEHEALYRDYIASIRKQSGIAVKAPDLDPKDTEMEFLPCLFFAVVNPVYRSGIQFLNP